MSKCVQCEKLNDELQTAALEYLKATVGQRPDDDLSKAGKKMDKGMQKMHMEKKK